MLHHVPSSEAQDAIFRELCRVLRKGALLVAADAVYSEDLLSFHEGDTSTRSILTGSARGWAPPASSRSTSTASSSAGCAPAGCTLTR